MSFSAVAAWNHVKTLAPFPESLTEYYADILQQYEEAHKTALTARLQGKDPILGIEPKTVFDLADRVNQMLGLEQFEGLADRLRGLLKSTTKEKAALTISQEIALGKFGTMDKQKALDYGVRTGLAVMTDGVTVAPIQGIYSVSIKQNDDNSEYASISYAGPMRSAGGTEAAFSLVIADITAKKLGLSSYRARSEEIGRFTEELRVYEREVGNFQYKVTDEDVRIAISNMPVEIDGVETDPVEVVVHRNLRRVATDRVRGGALRVLNDGVIGRAHKLAKKLTALNVTGWEWLSQLKGGTQQSTNETEQAGAHFEEVISGRAVLSMPRRIGGFRLRYGRSANTGLSTVGIHPAVAALLDYPVVVGTQVKVDLPGKAATIAFVDSIEGPTVLLSNGSVKKISSLEEAETVREKLVKIIDLGDILISYGDFLENNKNLPQSPYVTEWWIQELRRAIARVGQVEPRLTEAGISLDRLNRIADGVERPTPKEAIALSRILKIPLDPRLTPRFDRLNTQEILALVKNIHVNEDDIQFDVNSPLTTTALQKALIEYSIEGQVATIHGEMTEVLYELLSHGTMSQEVTPVVDPLELIYRLSGIRLGRQTTTTIGVRVGRPEKAMLRKLKPPVHTLFPVGTAGGQSRDLRVASKSAPLEIEVANIICPKCSQRRLSSKCEACGQDTQRFLACPKCGTTTTEINCPNCRSKTETYSIMRFDLKSRLDSIMSIIPHELNRPVKGVKGLTSQSKIPEAIEKGVLRSKNSVFVYKDGTMRIDATNAPLTHFRPSDLGTNINKLKELGYTTDRTGAPLVSESQVLELKPQDVILPKEIATDLVRMAQFIDDELQNLYGIPPFYKASRPEDLLGKIVIGLAPHTSVGVIGRIIGYSPAQVCFANPCWHAAKRRDCDGDGDSIILLIDALINFSIEFIPDQIGGLMDTPLLIQPVVLPAEVDEQAHNFDVADEYPVDFYIKTLESPPASAVEGLVERIGSRLGKDTQFHGYGYTHETTSTTIRRSRAAYSTLRTLGEKISKQIEVAEKIEAVSPKEVVESIIKTHLIRDIMGNTKKYATQSFKCKRCGMVIRRPPLSWSCPRCGGDIKETLSRASVEKYLSIAQKLATVYDVDPYLRSRLDVVKRELDQLFPTKQRSTQIELTEFTKSQAVKEMG